MAQDSKYLQRRGYSWYVVVRVPPSLQKVAGAAHLRKALGTKDKREAQSRRWKVVAHLKEKKEIGPADVKDLLGISRKYAIPLMEYLDSQRVTVRQGERRVLRSAQPG